MNRLKEKWTDLRAWWSCHSELLFFGGPLLLMCVLIMLALLGQSLDNDRRDECNRRGGYYTREQCIIGECTVLPPGALEGSE